MNDYFSGLANDVPSSDPNEWSRMLMSVANTNNAWSAEQAQKQMDFQERMSNTAHQREIADLKAAGLNPVLSAKLGGASTPSGASATSDTSVVSSLVQLMDKMLDVQGTSAAAAYNASGGSNATVGYNTGSSGYQELNSYDQNSLLKLFTRGQVDNNTSNALVNLWNNVKTNVANGVEWLGDKLKQTTTSAKDFYDPSKPAATAAGQKIKEGVNKAISAVKDFGKWLFTGKSTSKANGGR